MTLFDGDSDGNGRGGGQGDRGRKELTFSHGVKHFVKVECTGSSRNIFICLGCDRGRGGEQERGINGREDHSDEQMSF